MWISERAALSLWAAGYNGRAASNAIAREAPLAALRALWMEVDCLRWAALCVYSMAK